MAKIKRTVTLGHKDGKTMDASNPKRLGVKFVITAVIILAVLVIGYSGTGLAPLF